MLLHHLNRSYPYFYGHRKWNSFVFFLAALFVLHTMVLIRPNVIVSQIRTNYIIASFAYALITFSIAMLWAELPIRLFLNWLKEWKVYKELLLTISCIFAMGSMNYLYIVFFGEAGFRLRNFDLSVYSKVVAFTVGSGVVPLFLLTLLNFLKLEKSRRESRAVSLQNSPMQSAEEHEIIIKDGTEAFKFVIHHIFCIESMGNYVKIYSSADAPDRVTIVRITMKRMTELLQSQDFLLRIHRSYIVNIHHIKRMHKSESGSINIFLSGSDMVIPVSRNKQKELESLLKL